MQFTTPKSFSVIGQQHVGPSKHLSQSSFRENSCQRCWGTAWTCWTPTSVVGKDCRSCCYWNSSRKLIRLGRRTDPAGPCKTLTAVLGRSWLRHWFCRRRCHPGIWGWERSTCRDDEDGNRNGFTWISFNYFKKLIKYICLNLSPF